MTVSRAAPPSPPGFWERIGNWVDNLIEGNKPEVTQTMDKVTESAKPETVEGNKPAPNLNNLRRSAVRKAWKEEKKLVKSGEAGTRE